jgi:tetratricopeptide (TPR) repeat protein
MRKMVVVSCVAASFFLAAAFRYVTGYHTVKGIDMSLLRRQSAISCRIPPSMPGEPADIPPLTGWGSHRWKITTTSDSAQFYFDQGINMYYAFHTLEARASFAKALRFDSTCAMAYYGKALALGPTINFGNGFRAERAAYDAAVAAERFANGCGPMEKGLIAAMGKRYTEDTAADLKMLQVRYSSAMKAVAAVYLRNADVVALYADALMLEHPWDLYDAALQPKPWTPEIRSVLQRALAIDPLHPGALHFMIHTVEGSYLGNVLLKMGAYGEAVNVFDRDLQINPANGWSLTGLKLAYAGLHDRGGVERVKVLLSQAWQIKDQEVEWPVFGAIVKQ